MKRYSLIVALLLFTGLANAQVFLKGTVAEEGTNTRLTNVFIKNLNNKQLTLADKDGKFSIPAAEGNILVFNSPGYLTDTMFITDMRPKNILLKSITISLKEIDISGTRDKFNPREEYADVYTKSKVYVFSPSTWFSREGKNARRLKKYFAREEQEREVDKVYTKKYVGSIVPLKGIELQNFMLLYRPTYAYVHNNDGPSVAVFINDSYKKYLALPPEQRRLPRLVSQ